MCAFVSNSLYVAINIYKTTNLARRFFGVDRFMVLINMFMNVVYGDAINTIYKLGLSGFW